MVVFLSLFVFCFSSDIRICFNCTSRCLQKTKNPVPAISCWDRTNIQSCGTTRLDAFTHPLTHTIICRPLITESHTPSPILRLCRFCLPSEVHSSCARRRASTVRDSLPDRLCRITPLPHRFTALYHAEFVLSRGFFKKIKKISRGMIHALSRSICRT